MRVVMPQADKPPVTTRRLGRSRLFAQGDLPERLLRWHAPRANRWERLDVVAGEITTQWLNAASVVDASMGAGQTCWIGPGTRWRIAAMGTDAAFTLEVHADESCEPAQPQPLRAQLLDAMQTVHANDVRQIAELASTLVVGAPVLLRACFSATPALTQALRTTGVSWFWHPLEVGVDTCVAVLGRTHEVMDLGDYLGRDHALIEAALAGALRGDTQRLRWLHGLLGRHLRIEEELLFPAYLQTGGRAGWVRGLCNEHRMLRHGLSRLDDPNDRRRFLLLLDGHDEKEEQIVYPDIIARLQDAAPELTRKVMAFVG